jgi:uncharacterized protein related to proFAR isomerase
MTDETMMEPVAPEAPWWTKLEGLPSMMKALAQQREMAAIAEQRVAITEKAMAATPEGMAFTAARVVCTEVKADLAALDAAVRAEALKDFTSNGEKQVYAGVQVKMQTKVEVFTDRVKDWAIKHMPNLLVLDMKAVEKIAKTGTMDAELARVYKEPQVNIDKDLTAYLAQPE